MVHVRMLIPYILQSEICNLQFLRLERPLMNLTRSFALLAIGCLCLPTFAEDAKSLFDGKTLDGWKGSEKFWSVKDGAITGQTTKENPTNGNTFLIWQGGEIGDFELKLQFKIVG